MCFFKSDFECEKRYKVSDKDIPCYKIVMSESGSDVGISEIVGFRYQVGREYVEDSVPLDELDDPGLGILTDGVFHSYICLSLGMVLPYYTLNAKGYNFYWYGADTRKKEWSKESRQLAKIALYTLGKLINKGNA